MMLETGYSNNI